MAAITRVHAFFRPLIRKGKISVTQVNKLHISHNISYFKKTTNSHKLYQRCTYLGTPIRFQSTTSDPSVEKLSDTQSTNISETISNIQIIPEPPPIPETSVNELAQLANVINESGIASSLASQGLGGWWPSGIAQEFINAIHTSLDLPWWLAIGVGTVIIRTFLFPVIIYGQRHVANLSNHSPQMQLLQFKMTEARKSGDQIETSRYANELVKFMKEKNLNPLKGLITPLVQAPIFISLFFGLRKMATLPLESMTEGGIFWFTNLTIPDPLYILPVITSATFFLTIHLGIDSMPTQASQIMFYVLRAMPFMMFPFIINFPSAVLCYWVTSNILSLFQVVLLKLPPVRAFFKLPIVMKNTQQINSPHMKKKSFVEGFKDSLTNSKIAGELDERKRLMRAEEMFRKAGTGPIPKTYKYDPTSQIPANSRNSVMAKKREE